jgi:enamine deaminase RidA (YjgF/YER057c/UK114 family)
MSTIEHLRPKGLFHNPAFSQVVTASGTKTIYISGQVSIDADGAPVGTGDLSAQTTQVMRNLGLALAAAGASFTDVVKITTYVVNYAPEQRAVISKARSPFFAGGEPPASTLLGISALALPEWLIEVEAIAVVG